MDVRDYQAALRAHWGFFLIAVALCVGAAAALVFTQAPVYEARTQFLVSAGDDAADPSQAYQGGLFVQQRVVTYAHIISSPVVAAAVIDRLRLPLTTDEFARDVAASVPTNTAILNVTVDNRSPSTAQAIAAALSETFPAYVTALERPKSGARSAVKVTVTSPPQLPTSPVSPHKALDLLVGVLLGVGGGVGGALLLDSPARRRRHEWRRGQASASRAGDADARAAGRDRSERAGLRMTAPGHER